MQSFKGAICWVPTMMTKASEMSSSLEQLKIMWKSIWAILSHQVTDKAKATTLGSERTFMGCWGKWRMGHQALRNHWWKQALLIPFSGYKYVENLTHHKKKKKSTSRIKKKTHGENINLRTIVSEKEFQYASAAGWQTAQVLHFIRVLTLRRTLTLFEKHFINTDAQRSSIWGHEEIQGLLWEASCPSWASPAVTRPLAIVSLWCALTHSSLLGLTKQVGDFPGENEGRRGLWMETGCLGRFA